MSGILGLFLADPIAIPAIVSEAALTSLRGPGDACPGTWSEPGRLLGMVLSVTSCSGPTRIPFRNESARIHAVAEGEIHNAPDILQRLARTGHECLADPGLEAVVHLSENGSCDWELGLNGPFAFAVWNALDKRLQISRDRFGLRSLFWCGGERGAAFASTLPALRTLLLTLGHELPEAADPADSGWTALLRPSGWKTHTSALSLYLAGFSIPAPYTWFDSVQALPPAGRLVWRPGTKPSVEVYWRPRFVPKRILSVHQAVSELEEQLSLCLHQQVTSGAEANVLLDEELPSYYVASKIAQSSKKQVRGCVLRNQRGGRSKGFPFQEAARAFGLDCQEEVLSPPEAGGLVDLVHALGQPLGTLDAWIAWTQAAKFQGPAGVLISSTGAREAWGASRAHRLYNATRLLPKSTSFPQFSFHRLSRFARLRGLCRDFIRPPQDLLLAERLFDPSGLLSHSLFVEGIELPEVPWPLDWQTSMSGHDCLCSADVSSFFPCQTLAGLEAVQRGTGVCFRHPWLDTALFEVLAHLPASLKINGAVPYWLLHQAFRNCQAYPVQYPFRQRFHHDSSPIHLWMARELSGIFQDSVLSVSSCLSAVFTVSKLRQTFEAHRAGILRIGPSLWALLMLELWLREHEVAV
jgi:asparagine synthase (glutamine-hydrolysing)